jgi:hypothetical protein
MCSKPPRTLARLGSLALLVGVTACGRCSPKGEPGTSSTAASPGPMQPAGSAAGFLETSRKLASLPPGSAIGEAIFSPDGSHVGIVARIDGRATVFLDGRQGAPYEDVRGLTFRTGGSGYAFVARKNGAELVVGDGAEGGQYDAVGTTLFAPDGRVVYSARRGDKWVIVVGSRETAVAASSDPLPILSPDGRRIVFAGQRTGAGKSHLRACSLELTACVDAPDHDGLTAATRDGSGLHLAYVVEDAGRQAVASVTLDDPGLVEKRSGAYDGVATIALSDGGGHLAFLASSGADTLLVKDGVEIPLPGAETTLELVVARSGRALCSVIVKGKVVAFLDGKRVGGEYEGIYSPIFSPDGSRFAFVADRGPKSFLVVNDGEGPSFDKVVNPRFTPDGTRIVYRARSDGRRFVVVADPGAKTLREHTRHEAVFDVMTSPDGKSVGYGVGTEQAFWWMVEKL